MSNYRDLEGLFANVSVSEDKSGDDQPLIDLQPTFTALTNTTPPLPKPTPVSIKPRKSWRDVVAAATLPGAGQASVAQERVAPSGITLGQALTIKPSRQSRKEQYESSTLPIVEALRARPRYDDSDSSEDNEVFDLSRETLVTRGEFADSSVLVETLKGDLSECQEERDQYKAENVQLKQENQRIKANAKQEIVRHETKYNKAMVDASRIRTGLDGAGVTIHELKCKLELAAQSLERQIVANQTLSGRLRKCEEERDALLNSRYSVSDAE